MSAFSQEIKDKCDHLAWSISAGKLRTALSETEVVSQTVAHAEAELLTALRTLSSQGDEEITPLGTTLAKTFLNTRIRHITGTVIRLPSSTLYTLKDLLAERGALNAALSKLDGRPVAVTTADILPMDHESVAAVVQNANARTSATSGDYEARCNAKELGDALDWWRDHHESAIDVTASVDQRQAMDLLIYTQALTEAFRETKGDLSPDQEFHMKVILDRLGTHVVATSCLKDEDNADAWEPLGPGGYGHDLLAYALKSSFDASILKKANILQKRARDLAADGTYDEDLITVSAECHDASKLITWYQTFKPYITQGALSTALRRGDVPAADHVYMLRRAVDLCDAYDPGTLESVAIAAGIPDQKLEITIVDFVETSDHLRDSLEQAEASLPEAALPDKEMSSEDIVVEGKGKALALVVGWSATAQQLPLGASTGILEAPEADPLADTIVSTLSASSQHTTLLRLLQRSKCIPLLAHIGNATVFAPTDAAWAEWADMHKPASETLHAGWLSSSGLEEWTTSEENGAETRENQNWALRQHLLYHMLNYTLLPDQLLAGDSRNVTIETTLLFPLSAEPPLPPTPPSGPPWLPRGGEGLLAGHGQRVRWAKRGSDAGGDRGRVGVEFTGEGGAGVWDGSGWKAGNVTALRKGKGKGKDDQPEMTGVRWTRNGVVIGVERVLDPPPSIDKVIHSHPSLRYLSHLLNTSSPLPSPIPDDLATTSHLTVFAPANGAFHSAFDDVEKRYLEGGYGSEGVARIFAGGIVTGVTKGQVGWSDTYGKQQYEKSVSGLELSVEPSEKGLQVNGTEVETVDIFASNGVVHILPNLLLPENFTLLNSAEKMLLSLNATRFVSLLRSANLSSTYIGEPGVDEEKSYTILAPTDEVLDMMDRWSPYGAPIPHVWRTAEAGDLQSDTIDNVETADIAYKDSSPLAALLQYHILPGRLTPGDIKDGMLVGTELRPSSLKGARQKLRVDVSERLDRRDWENIGEGEIRFGGATVLAKPVRSGKSIIYLISSLLSPPDDVLQTAVSDLQLSTFIAAVYAADLDKAFKKAPAVSYFVPRNRAFGSLGLAMRYLLLPEGKDELRKVIRYHVADELIYSADIENGRTVHKTLQGGEIIITRTKGKNGTLNLSSPTKWEGHDSGDDLPANGELRPASVMGWDALTSTGVIHTIDNVVLPADVDLTIGKLVRGSKQSTMVELMVRAGLAWVLEGRAPTSDEVSAASLQGVVRTWSDVQDEQGPDLDSLALPAYTLLVPTDKAFSRLNLTHYLGDKDALLDLLKLHIIPTQSNIPRTAKTQIPATPPSDGQPLSLGDDLVYGTLLSSKSKFGDVAFRATGDNSWLVGIRGARGGTGDDSARVGASGRASVKWRRNRDKLWSSKHKDKKDKSPSSGGDEVDEVLWRNGMSLGGGVFILDSVLVPYEPSWFNRWGWLVITLVGIGAVLLIGAICVGWWWFTKGKHEEYEPLEGEEED